MFSSVNSCLLVSTQEYRSRKRARLQKRIEEQLRTAAQTRPDTLGAHGSGSDLTELLQCFGGSPLIGDILAKGTRFTHTEKFTFTEVNNGLNKACSKDIEQDLQMFPLLISNLNPAFVSL